MFKILLSSRRSQMLILALIGLSLGGYFLFGRQTKSQETSPTTQIVQKGTLTQTIQGSGTITTGNNDSVTTKVSGTVANVLVQNGQTVKKGQTLAQINLDEYATERQTAAWVSYLEAQEAVKEAKKAKLTADIDMWQARQDILDAEKAIETKNTSSINPSTHEEYTLSERTIIDKSLEKAQLSFAAAESKYQHADADIQNAQAKVSAAYRNYQENSAIILAPSDGVISNLSLAPGLIINANSSTSTQNGATIISSQTIGKITHPEGQLLASISLSEIDILKVKAGQKVTLTLDAYADQTFTGSVLSVNTEGLVNSGVTSYPVSILLDPVSVDIYPNMAVSAEIITQIKTDVILIPTTALTSNNNQTTVNILKDGETTTVSVTLGEANDTQTEIISGLNPGDVILITPILIQEFSSSNTTTSPFSGTRNGNFMPGMGGGPPAGGF